MTTGPVSQAPAATASARDALSAKVRSAVIWRSGTQILGQLVSWVSTFLVIRILSPDDYGMVAMTGAVMLFLSLVNGYSFANALIQRESVSERELRQLFAILILLNAALCIAQLIAAPFAAAYYREPMVADLLYAQALIYPSTPFIVLAYTILSREMEFRRQAQVNILATIISAATAITGALVGWGVWTLVVAPLVMVYVRAIGTTIVARSWMWPDFRFDGAGHIVRFGSFVLVGQLFWFVQSQSDIFIVGRVYDAYELGIYSTALFLAQLFLNKVVPPLNEVAFSAYSRIREHDGNVAGAFLQSARLIMFIALPVFIGMAATAEPLVLVALGEKWAGTIALVAPLALAMPFKTMLSLLGPACNANDRPEIPTRNSIAGAVVMPVAFLIGLNWGLPGITYAWIAGFAAVLAIALYWTLPAIEIPLGNLVKALQPPVVAAFVMGLAVYIVGHLLDAGVVGPIVRLLAMVGTGGVTYLGWLYLFERASLREIIAIVINRKAPEPEA